MVSYYNSLTMFPHAGRPAPGPPAYPYSHPSYTAASYQHDQNSNLQLAYAGSFGGEFGHTAPWSHGSWSPSFPASCRSSYEWAGLEQGVPPPPPSSDVAPATPPSSSDPALPSPTSPSSYPRPEGSQSPEPSTDYHYKPALSPLPHYKAEPTSTSELGQGLHTGELSEDCPSPSSACSRPQPARSPYEWMKKPAYPSPTPNSDPNGESKLLGS